MRSLVISKQITSRESESIDKYLQEIDKVQLITGDTEAELARRIEQGDPVALEKLVKANLRFVVSVAKQYQRNGLSLGDLINEGNVGLIQAAKRFDEKRGFKFISYAVWWIRQSILQALAQQARMVRLPLNQVGTLNRIARTYAVLEQKFSRAPSSSEMSDAMLVPAKEIEVAMSIAERHISFDAPMLQHEQSNLLDVLKDFDAEEPDALLIRESLKQELRRALLQLTMRESDVLSCYFGLNGNAPLTLSEIGYKFNISPERVRQIKKKATLRLGQKSMGRHLRMFI